MVWRVPVAENGMLRTDADFSMTSINSVIAAMEAVLSKPSNLG